MSGEVAVLWTLGGLAVLACLVFVAIVVKFVAKAAVSYVKQRPYAAAAVFAVPGGLASFLTAWFGAQIPIAMLTGAVAGLIIFLLVAMELGAD